MANNISVSVTADIADLTAKRAILSAELQAASKDLRNFAEQARSGGMTDALKASMLEAAQAVAGTKAQVVAATAEIKNLGKESAGAAAGVKTAATAAQGLQQSLAGIGQALAAAFAVKQIGDIAKGMADTAEATAHAAVTFGLTTDQVQQLKAEAAGLGVPFDAFTTAMQRVDKALLTARESGGHVAEAFKTLGIDIHQPIDQATLLQRAIAGLATIQDVPTRIGVAMQLFGRNIENLGPVIGATKEQIAAIASATDRFGAVNLDAQAKGLALAEAFNQQKIAMMGLGLTLTSALGPSLTQLVTDATGLIESFREWSSQGDNLKSTLTGLGIAAAVLATVLGAGALTAAVTALVGLLPTLAGALAIATAGMVKFDLAADANPVGAVVLAVEALAAGLYFLTDGFNKTNMVTVQLVDTFKAWADEAAQCLRALFDLVASLMDVGKAIQALNRGDLSGISQAVQDLANRWRDADAASKQYAADAAGVTTALDQEAAAAARAGAALAALGAHMQGEQGSGTPGSPEKQALPSGSAKKKRGGGDEMQQYQADLAQMQDATRARTGAWLADLTQMDLDYWNAVLANAQLSAKQREDVERTIADLTRKVNADKQTDLLAIDKAFIDADKGNLAQLTNDWRQYVDDTVAAYGAGAKQVVEAQAQMADALRAEQTRETDEAVTDIVAGVNREIEAYKKLTEAQKQAAEQAARSWKTANNEILSAETTLIGDALKGRLNFAQIVEQTALQMATKEIAADVRYFTERALLQAEGFALDQSKEEGGVLIHLLAERQKTAATQQGVLARSMAEVSGFFAKIISEIASLLGIHIAAEGTKTAVTVKASQAQAGAAGVASFAAAPWPIDMGAPAFGSAMAVAAGAFGAAATAAGGYDIPAGVNPLTQLHAEEMVLPASIANPVRAMAEGGGPWGGGGSGGDINFGDFHVHGAPGGMSSSEFRQALSDHANHVANAVGSAVRGGWRAPRGLSSPFAR